MPYIIPNDATHVLLSIIVFDDGEPEIGVLDFGDFASCDKTARMMSALSYSGERKVRGAFVSVREVADVFPNSRSGAETPRPGPDDAGTM